MIITVWLLISASASCNKTQQVPRSAVAGSGGYHMGAKVDAQGLKFDEPDFPFTFVFPEALYAHASMGLPLAQGRDVPTMGPQNYSFQLDEHDGIAVKRAAAAEFTNEELTQKVREMVTKDRAGGTITTAICGGREVLVLDRDFEYNDNSPEPAHSTSYAFSYAGATWQVEFYSTDRGRQVVTNAGQMFAKSLTFKNE